MNFIVSAVTDIGLIMPTNQDSCSVRVFCTEQGKMVFAILCDGMGGLSRGEVASAAVVDAFNQWSVTRLPQLCKKKMSDEEILNDWKKILLQCNEGIKQYGRRRNVSMGTTVTAILLTPQRYYIANVGDTRAYEIKETIRMLTKDQTVVAREVELGILSPEEARADPRKNVLLQCIGASEYVYPEFVCGNTKQGAVYMLCSDGFRHKITEKEMFSHLNPRNVYNDNYLKKKLQSLVQLNKKRKERDNITVVAVKTC